MKTALAQYLRDHGADEETINLSLSLAEPMELPTRHILLNQGELPSYAFFLVDGICHACYLTADGRQFSKEFYWEQELILGFESLLTKQPSEYLLETLSASQILALPLEVVEQWKTCCPGLYMALLERQLLFKEHKERFMLIHTPEERYTLFCGHFPELQAQLADYQIASYLGITATSLSRIRARLSEES
ncbi:Crp/Fnr family transcriptional regulator [Photobacterium rosenbergii]|uniref:Crp/Fnr family transcriptional regulator n=1 Tax=Photobacterium rosenbergii TaxID=294936 RepID=UPI001C99A2E1|nr:Crp/Fnr family transcriptional regulator [Photobacterium rosenbergii]MBY5948469.1 Crp/Fnr family transcriptional regulator [Photobacterium rosenbergii]